MYVHATTIVIMISTLLSFGITTWILSYAFKIVFEEYAGWLPFYVEGSVYIKMFIMTVISYLFFMMIQIIKYVKKIRLRKEPYSFSMRLSSVISSTQYP